MQSTRNCAQQGQAAAAHYRSAIYGSCLQQRRLSDWPWQSESSPRDATYWRRRGSVEIKRTPSSTGRRSRRTHFEKSSHLWPLHRSSATTIPRLSSSSDVMLDRQALEQPSCKEVDRLHIRAERYAQIENEMLAIVFSLKKFHQYTYGRHVKIQSDHKPLESILQKPPACPPRRLQGMI